MNFIFLKFFLIVCFLKTIICDSSVIIPLGVMLVNHKFQFFRFSWKFIFIGQFFILICNFRIIFIVVYCVVYRVVF